MFYPLRSVECILKNYFGIAGAATVIPTQIGGRLEVIELYIVYM